MQNNIDVTLTGEQLAEIDTAVEALNAALTFLVSLTPAARKKMLKMGPRTESFVRTALEAAQLHPDAIPTTLNVTELSRDLALREHLAGVELAIGSILQKVQDTRRVAGSDLYAGALDIYQALQRHGVSEGVDLAVSQLRERFRRAATVVPTEPEAPATT